MVRSASLDLWNSFSEHLSLSAIGQKTVNQSHAVGRVNVRLIKQKSFPHSHSKLNTNPE